MNGAEKLCLALYGRAPEIDDTVGGLDAKMLHDAAAVLNALARAGIEDGAVICIPMAEWTAAWPAVGR